MKKQTDPEQAFGVVLRELRKSAGLTQEGLALDSGLDRTYISMLERGLRQPSLQTLLNISRCLGVSAANMVEQVEAMLGD